MIQIGSEVSEIWPVKIKSRVCVYSSKRVYSAKYGREPVCCWGVADVGCFYHEIAETCDVMNASRACQQCMKTHERCMVAASLIVMILISYVITVVMCCFAI